jgi:chromosome segregation ATPase
MSGQSDNLLRRLDALSDRITVAAADLKRQVALLEAQGAALARRMDHIEGRLARIERRLEDML